MDTVVWRRGEQLRVSVGLCFFEDVKAVDHRWQSPALGLGGRRPQRSDRVLNRDPGRLC
jgi:hypothetical protein